MPNLIKIEARFSDGSVKVLFDIAQASLAPVEVASDAAPEVALKSSAPKILTEADACAYVAHLWKNTDVMDAWLQKWLELVAPVRTKNFTQQVRGSFGNPENWAALEGDGMSGADISPLDGFGSDYDWGDEELIEEHAGTDGVKAWSLTFDCDLFASLRSFAGPDAHLPDFTVVVATTPDGTPICGGIWED